MLAPVDPVTVNEDQLGALHHLANGGMAKVYALPSFQIGGDTTRQWVYKKFRSKVRPVPLYGMESIVRLRNSLAPEQRDQIDRSMVWPARAVVDNGYGAAGVVLPLIPAEFFLTLRLSSERKRKPAEGQFLFMDRDYCARVEVPFVRDQVRRQLCHRLCFAFALLHRAGVVYGDLSARNFIFTTVPRPALLLVDCDAVRVRGEASVFGSQPHSPDWEPPEALLARRRKDSGGFTIQNEETDRYKLGLAILRVLTPGAGCSTNRDPDRARNKLPWILQRLLTRSLDDDPAGRPSAREWYEEMKHC